MTPRRIACLALSGLIFGAAARLAAEELPPQDLYLVADHWTAWEPPATFPEGTELYTVQQGDTLWDLANRFYGNPYLWPQLWERNRYILDAHWIYPGDPLVVGIEVTPLEELAEIPVSEEVAEAPAAEEELERALARPTGAPVPLGSEDDIYCSGYIGALEERFDHQITGSEHESLNPTQATRGARKRAYRSGQPANTKLGLTTGDILYVDGGRAAGMMPGEVYTVVAPERVVRHPRSGRVLGRFYRFRGRLQILSVQEGSGIAEVVHACGPIAVGDDLNHFVPEPVPLARRSGMRGVNDPVTHEELLDAAAIVHSDAGLMSLGEGHVVFIDRGSRHEVTPGDIYTIYRQTPAGQPLLVIGELAVLSVKEEASLAKILESRYTIHIGDLLDPEFR